MTSPLWTSADLAKASGGKVNGIWSVTGISIDSRTLQPGDLFIALKGDKFDGHDHIADALKAGAGGVMSARDVPGATNILRVDDTQKALEKLAKNARARIKEEVFAVTGSVGKTTTKEMLKAALAAQGDVHATTGNLNNHIGLPLTLARAPQDTNFGVFELGMNHTGEIAPLSKLLRPDVAIITNIGTAHIQNFAKGQLGIAEAKAEIFAGITEDGIAILPRDSEFFLTLSEAVKEQDAEEIFSFGTHKSADGRLISFDNGTVRADIMGNVIEYKLQLAGEHMALNSVAVLLALAAVGLDVAAGVKAISAMEPLKGRGQRSVINGITVIDECYNASPLSMNAAIRVLGETTTTGRRIAALGEMLELGDTAPSAHADLLQALTAAKVDSVFCCGALMKHLWDVVPEAMRGGYAENAAALAPLVAQATHAGDTVLVKGSRGQQVAIKGVMSPSMAQIIAALDNKEMHAHVA